MTFCVVAAKELSTSYCMKSSAFAQWCDDDVVFSFLDPENIHVFLFGIGFGASCCSAVGGSELPEEGERKRPWLKDETHPAGVTQSEKNTGEDKQQDV